MGSFALGLGGVSEQILLLSEPQSETAIKYIEKRQVKYVLVDCGL